MTSSHVEQPKKVLKTIQLNHPDRVRFVFLKVKFELIPSTNTDEVNQDSLIRHLQNRISDLRDDNMRLRDSQKSKPIMSSFHEVTIFSNK